MSFYCNCHLCRYTPANFLTFHADSVAFNHRAYAFKERHRGGSRCGNLAHGRDLDFVLYIFFLLCFQMAIDLPLLSQYKSLLRGSRIEPATCHPPTKSQRQLGICNSTKITFCSTSFHFQDILLLIYFIIKIDFEGNNSSNEIQNGHHDV